MEHNGSYWKKWAGAFLFGVALITVYKTFDNLSNVFSAIGSFIGLLTPFIIGFVLAFFLYPATIKVEKLLEKSKKTFFAKRKKSLAVLLVYLAFIGVLVFVGSVFVPRLSASMAELLKKIPWYFAQLEVFFTNLVKEGGFLEKLNMNQILNNLDLQTMLQNFLSRDIWGYLESVKGLTNTFFNIIMGIVIGAYTLLERGSLLRIAKMIFLCFMKPESVQRLGAYAARISGIFYRFFYGKAVDSLIIGILALIGFILLKVPYAGLMALVVMVFNMIPYFGPFIGAAPVILVSLLTGGWYPAIWVSLFILALQQFDGLWLGPKILGGSLGISPFWVIFAIVVFGGLFGFWGMIFGVPLVAAIRMLLLDFLDDGKLNLSHSIAKK